MAKRARPPAKPRQKLLTTGILPPMAAINIKKAAAKTRLSKRRRP